MADINTILEFLQNPATLISVAGFLVNLTFNILNYGRTTKLRRADFSKTTFESAAAEPLRAALKNFGTIQIKLRSIQTVETNKASSVQTRRKRVSLIKKLQEEEIVPAISEFESAISKATNYFARGTRTRDDIPKKLASQREKVDEILNDLNILLDETSNQTSVSKTFQTILEELGAIDTELNEMMNHELSKLLGVKVKRR